MDILPILTDNGKYPEMEIGLLQTDSSYKYAAEWLICEIPTLKPMFDYANVLAILENMVLAFGITFPAIILHYLLLLPVCRPPFWILHIPETRTTTYDKATKVETYVFEVAESNGHIADIYRQR